MALTRSKAKKSAVGKDAILFRFRDRDTAYGVTRRTAHELANHIGMSETQVLHVALAKMAKDFLPTYEQDEGPLTERQMAIIATLAPQGRMKVVKSLI